MDDCVQPDFPCLHSLGPKPREWCHPSLGNGMVPPKPREWCCLLSGQVLPPSLTPQVCPEARLLSDPVLLVITCNGLT